MSDTTRTGALPLTGERTGPDDGTPAWQREERYWFDRHLAGYRLAARLAARGRGGPVVDLGAGEGYGLALVAAAASAPGLGVELDAAAAAHARRRYPGLGVVRGNVVALPLADEVADVVVSSQVLEHVWAPLEHLAEARRVLRPGGLLVCTTPNRLTFSPGLPRGGRPANLYHHREYDAAELLALAGTTGWSAVQLLGVHGPLPGRQTGPPPGHLPGSPPLSAPGAGGGGPGSAGRDGVRAGFRVAPDGPSARLDAALDLVLVARRPVRG